MNTTGLYGPQLHTVQYVHNIQTVASPSSAKGSVFYAGIQNILGQCVSNITGTVAQDVQPLIINYYRHLNPFRPLNNVVADQYHFDTDPDPGCEKFVWIQTEGLYGFGSGPRPKIMQIRIQIQAKKKKVPGKSKKFDKNAYFPCFVCLYYLTITFQYIVI